MTLNVQVYIEFRHACMYLHDLYTIQLQMICLVHIIAKLYNLFSAKKAKLCKINTVIYLSLQPKLFLNTN